MEPLDLLVLCPKSTFGGAETVAFQIARGAKRAGWSVEAWFKEPFESKELRAKFDSEAIPVRCTENLKPASIKQVPSKMFGLAKEIRTRGVRSVNLHNPGNTILAGDVLACRLAGVQRVVCSLHHPIPLAEQPRSQLISTRIAAQFADCVVGTTPALTEQLAQMGVPASKMKIVPLGAEPMQRVLTKAQARKELDVPEGAFVVGALGRLVPHKRIGAVIEACSISPRFMENGLLLIAGSGEEEANLKALAKVKLGERCRFLGYVADASAFYPALDIFALPSELEGFGLVYIEAALAGVPSIGCDAGGTRYAIQDGVTGHLLPAGDLSGLSGLIESLASDKTALANLGQAAKARAESQFTMSALESAYLSLLSVP